MLVPGNSCYLAKSLSVSAARGQWHTTKRNCHRYPTGSRVARKGERGDLRREVPVISGSVSLMGTTVGISRLNVPVIVALVYTQIVPDWRAFPEFAFRCLVGIVT